MRVGRPETRVVAKIYATTRAAAELAREESREGGAVVAPGARPRKSNHGLADPKQTSGSTWPPHANDIRNEIEAVYKAGIEVGYFPGAARRARVYGKPDP